MMVNAAAEKKRPIGGVGVFGGETSQSFANRKLRQPFGKIDARALTQCFRNVLVEFFNGLEPDGPKHPLLIGGSVWGIAHAWCSFLLFVFVFPIPILIPSTISFLPSLSSKTFRRPTPTFIIISPITAPISERIENATHRRRSNSELQRCRSDDRHCRLPRARRAATPPPRAA